MAKYGSILISVIFFLLQNEHNVKGDVSKRNVKTTLWPDCEQYPKSCIEPKLNIVYVKASASKSANDILHYAYSTVGVPTVLVAHTTGVDANMKFDWDKLVQNGTSMAKGVQIESAVKGKDVKVEYQMAVAFTKLIEYNDVSDDANLESYSKKKKDQEWLIRNLNTSSWQGLMPGDKMKKNSFQFSTKNYTSPITNETLDGNLTLAFRVPDSDGRVSLLPSLKYSPNETLFDFILANYTPSFEQSRFAVEVVVVSESNKRKDAVMSIKESQTIDDEYSPGVFRTTQWRTDSKAHKGYLQWKPVCYLAKSRDRSEVSKVVDYKLEDLDSRPKDQKLLNNSLVYALFGDQLWKGDIFTVKASNISFGLAKDGFYVGTNYTVWSAAIGYGNVPKETISTTVIIIIACGLGLPVLMIIFGGIYMLTKRLRRSNELGYYPVSTN